MPLLLAENPDFRQLFTFDTPDKIRASRDVKLQEAGAASALTLLAAIEASFRIDHLLRNHLGEENALSRAFRDLNRNRRDRHLSFSEILQAWRHHPDVSPALVGDIRTAFKYRDWLAHGRYWVPKLGRQYNFERIYDLCSGIESAFPFLRS